MDGFKELLENSVFTDETKASLLEAWNKKIEETRSELREEIEIEVRDDFKKRFENAKDRLYEATDIMLRDAVEKYSSEMIEESIKLKKEKEQLAKAVTESRKISDEKIKKTMSVFEDLIVEQLRGKILSLVEDKKNLEKTLIESSKKEIRIAEANKLKRAEDLEKLNNFVLGKLSEQVNELQEQERLLKEEKERCSVELREHKITINEEMAERINALETFIMAQLKEELVEFKQEKDSLATLRVKMVKESKENLNKTRTEFVKRAAALIESTISDRLNYEIDELKESIKVARENDFGRKIFEAYKNSFMQSYLAEGTEVRKVENELADVKSKLDEALKENVKQKKLVESTKIRLNLTEERVKRGKTLNKLLSTLNKDKRDLMETLLETVKTDDLEKNFHKYLPVLKEEQTPRSTKKVLSEGSTSKANPKLVNATGNKTINESVQTDDEKDTEELRAYLRRTAGIKN